MWRSIFLAIGVMLIIIGLETLLIDSATVYSAAKQSAVDFVDPTTTPGKSTRVIKPGEWLPWTSLSVGTIVVLYVYTLPRRWHR